MSSFWKGDIDDMIPHKFSGQHTMVAHAMTTHDTPENATKPTSPGREHKAQNSSRPNGTFSNHGSSIRKPERLLGVKAVHLLVSRLGVTCLVLPGSGQLWIHWCFETCVAIDTSSACCYTTSLPVDIQTPFDWEGMTGWGTICGWLLQHQSSHSDPLMMAVKATPIRNTGNQKIRALP